MVQSAKRAIMSLKSLVVGAAIGAGILSIGFAPGLFAEESPDGSFGEAGVGAELAPGTVGRFRLGYMNSQTGVSPRSATVVTVTNTGASTDCTVSIDWRRGFSPTGPGGTICTTTFANLQRGQSADFCTRPLPGSVTSCNATCSPALTFDEGNAFIGSTNTATCSRITVSARVYYFGNTSDTVIEGITDPKITKIQTGTSGD